MESDSSPKTSPVAESFGVSATKEPTEAAETPPKQNEKTLLILTSFFEQLHKNPTALASFVAVMKQQIRPTSTQPPPKLQKELPAKQLQKKSRKRSTQQRQIPTNSPTNLSPNGQTTEVSKLSHSRSLELPIRTKEPPLKSCYEKRQHIIINPADIRLIQTPDFVSADANPIDSRDIKPIINFDQLKAHTRLEICENRIITGKDEKFSHPAYAVQSSRENGELEYSPDEERKTKNYTFIEVKQQTPLFWPTRAWDNQENTMQQAQSDKLLEEIMTITEMTKTVDSCVRPVHSRPPSTSPRIRRTNSSRANKARSNRKMKDLTMSFSFANYLTDDESDMTDFEDF